MDAVLRCNNHINGFCRRELREEAFVTTCSHIFCRECVQQCGFQDIGRGRRECLACEAALPSVMDVVKTNLRPKEELQSTILSGLNPSTILDCAGKALRFWNYQMCTEIAWQEHLSKEWEERFRTLNINARKVIDDANTDIADLQKQLETVKLEKHEVERQAEDIARRLGDKAQKCTQVEKMYTTLKEKVLADQTRGAAAASAEHAAQNMGSLPRPEPFSHPPYRSEFATTRKTPYQNIYPINTHGVEQLHPFQRSGSACGQTSSEGAPAARSVMPPPVHNGRREAYSRLSSTNTPAQRVNLPRSHANLTFPGTSYRPSASQSFPVYSVDRQSLGQDKPRYHRHQAATALSPNLHSRMVAGRHL